ncbi:serine/threonine protein kinase [Piscinibacter sp. HJYY11]|uniref:serine/threonine protein kinase n=1 Tax=Piscinibacter sp. HJYY11 TaxID=2801333 RepID=UPI00191EEA5F|nr:serine/threonine protein kinase [Piscinibacter sp. HJYY11]MBL0728278.1 serine/threonine protein kinase [Piscinibacter sp. HJYY11]
MPSPSTISDTPYAGLTPEAVLDALDTVGLRGDGRLIQLNSYENRVFQVFLEDGPVVVAKFYRPGRWSDAQILEEHAFAAELAEAEIPVVAPRVLNGTTLPSFSINDQAYRFSVTPRQSGRAPELEDPATLEWIGRFIGRIHSVGARTPFTHRLTLSLDSHGTSPRDWLLDSGLIAIETQQVWKQTVDQVLDEVQRSFDAAGAYRPIRLHGDCHVGNVLWTEAGPHFVDLDDALMGPPVQDLWMLLSGERQQMQQQLTALLTGYEDFMDFDWRQLRMIEALRALRMIHYSAWLARRWADPAFPVAFPWFGDRNYWSEQIIRLRDQLDAMREPPLGGSVF